VFYTYRTSFALQLLRLAWMLETTTGYFYMNWKTRSKKNSSATNKNFFFLYFFVKYIHITTCLCICPHTDAFFGFVTNAEKWLRQGENNSPKTSNIKIIKLPIRLTLFSLLIMKNFYMFSILLTFVIIFSFEYIKLLTLKLLYSLIKIWCIKLLFYSLHSRSVNIISGLMYVKSILQGRRRQLKSVTVKLCLRTNFLPIPSYALFYAFPSCTFTHFAW